MRGLIDKLKKNLVDFGQDESGMGVIEVILIILVLVGLALIFKKQIGDIADGIFTSIKNSSRQVLMRLKASVTIFLSLVITVVIVVVCTVIESARISVSQMEGKAATYMAVESVFAGYGKQLYQDYGILLAWEQEPLGNQVTRYMQDNINMADLDFKNYDFSNMEIESVNILKQNTPQIKKETYL